MQCPLDDGYSQCHEYVTDAAGEMNHPPQQMRIATTTIKALRKEDGCIAGHFCVPTTS